MDEKAASHNAFVRFFIKFWTAIWEIWLEPFLVMVGAYEPPDRTYGRAQIPFSKMEERLHSNPDVMVSFHKAWMPNGKDWVWYQVWEDKAAQRVTGRVADVVFFHGTGVHSGTLASHSRRYLDAGFRLIVPDMPSHGYSTGLHVYQRYAIGYTVGIRAAIHDVARRDDELAGKKIPKQERRTTFFLALSFGGMIAILYPLYYPACNRTDTTDMDEIPVDGVVGVGPIVDYSRNDVKIGMIVHVTGFLVNVLCATRLELMVPHKKVVDKDPKVYKQLIESDKRSHNGAFRVGHLFCIRDGVDDIDRLAKNFTLPVYIQHGLQDRVVQTKSTLKFLANCSSTDKRFTVYPVCQHVVYRKAKSETEDLAGRVCVLDDNVAWMCERSPGHGHIDRGISFSSDILESDSKPAGGSSAPFSRSGSITPGWDAVTPSESLPQTPSIASDTMAMGTDKSNVVTGTINSLTSQIDSVIESAAVASAVPDARNELRNRTDKQHIRETKQTAARQVGNMAEECRVYRPDWELPKETCPFDITLS
ncbi:hypothetical protein MSPP1_002225 [Malassezia sp. CBS 17886]|nr:hypothetical protein MSPP1_002225 [Malassezia sp. CBS 17886]